MDGGFVEGVPKSSFRPLPSCDDYATYVHATPAKLPAGKQKNMGAGPSILLPARDGNEVIATGDRVGCGKEVDRRSGHRNAVRS